MKIKRGEIAFTLLEVMIACFIFFICIFTILELITRNLKAAHSLTNNRPHAGMLAGAYSLSNRLEEGIETGDFGDSYPGYSWQRETVWAGSNGFFRVDFLVYRDADVDSGMSILLYRPDSPQVSGTRYGR